MLPILKDWVATQECVGEQVTNKESACKYTQNEAQQYRKGKQVTFDLLLETSVRPWTYINQHQSKW